MRSLFFFLFLIFTWQAWSAQPSSLLDPIEVEESIQVQLQAQIQEDAQAIEKVMTVFLNKAQEKSQTQATDKSLWKRSLEAAAFKLAKSKVWIFGFNKRVFAQYPELVMLDPVLRIIRSAALYPFLISTGQAKLIPIVIALPDVEIIDAAYFWVREWIKKKKFAQQYGVHQSELDQFKQDLLAREVLPQTEIEKMINDPVLLKNLLGMAATGSTYQSVLHFWNDSGFYSNLEEGLSHEIKLLVSIENLILRLEIEGTLYEPQVSTSDLMNKAKLKQWFSLLGERRELYKVIGQLKNFQYLYLSSLYKKEVTSDAFINEFSLLRDKGLSLLADYGKNAMHFDSIRSPKVLMCRELF